MTPLTPDALMAQIAASLPEDCWPNVIIIGSPAAGCYFFSGDAQRSIRTKDVDCMFSPYAKAVAAAGQVTERLLDADWQQRKEGQWASLTRQRPNPRRRAADDPSQAAPELRAAQTGSSNCSARPTRNPSGTRRSTAYRPALATSRSAASTTLRWRNTAPSRQHTAYE